MEPDERHPATEILSDPLSEETRKNRRALLAVTSVCIAVRITGSFPRQISALGIIFTGTDAQRLTWLVLALQCYLCAAFVLSALADFVRWKRALRDKTSTYIENNMDYSVSDAVDAADDYLRGAHFRLEAPEQRMKTELQSYAQGKDNLVSLAKMLWKSFPAIFLQLVLLFLFPVILYFISVVSLLFWLPTLRFLIA